MDIWARVVDAVMSIDVRQRAVLMLDWDWETIFIVFIVYCFGRGMDGRYSDLRLEYGKL